VPVSLHRSYYQSICVVVSLLLGRRCHVRAIDYGESPAAYVEDRQHTKRTVLPQTQGIGQLTDDLAAA
jgi:hypothetical protein